MSGKDFHISKNSSSKLTNLNQFFPSGPEGAPVIGSVYAAERRQEAPDRRRPRGAQAVHYRDYYGMQGSWKKEKSF